MNPKKETDKKAKNAGISLEPDIKARGTELAKKRGFKSLSSFTHKLLCDALAADQESMRHQQRPSAADLLEALTKKAAAVTKAKTTLKTKQVVRKKAA